MTDHIAPVASAQIDHATAADVANNALNHLAAGSGQILEKGTDLIKAIAQATQKAAPQVWEILVRQQMIIGVTNIGIFIFLLVCFILMWKLHKFTYNKYTSFLNHMSDPTPALGTVLITICVGGALFIATLNGFQNTVGHLLNPSYYAAMDLIDRVQGKKNCE